MSLTWENRLPARIAFAIRLLCRDGVPSPQSTILIKQILTLIAFLTTKKAESAPFSVPAETLTWRPISFRTAKLDLAR